MIPDVSQQQMQHILDDLAKNNKNNIINSCGFKCLQSIYKYLGKCCPADLKACAIDLVHINKGHFENTTEDLFDESLRWLKSTVYLAQDAHPICTVDLVHCPNTQLFFDRSQLGKIPR